MARIILQSAALAEHIGPGGCFLDHSPAPAGQHVVANAVVQDDSVEVSAVHGGDRAERADRLRFCHRRARRRSPGYGGGRRSRHPRSAPARSGSGTGPRPARSPAIWSANPAFAQGLEDVGQTGHAVRAVLTARSDMTASAALRSTGGGGGRSGPQKALRDSLVRVCGSQWELRRGR